MLKSYFKLAIRSLLRNKLSAFINILGLSLAVGSAIVIFTFIEFSLNKDEFHEHAEEIFMVECVFDRNGEEQLWGITPAPLGKSLREDFPQLQRVVSIEGAGARVAYENTVLDQGLWFVDEDMLDMFSFPLKKGDKEALRNPNATILSSSAAERFFGDTDPIGKTLRMTFADTLQLEFIVGGVAEKFNDRASFAFNILLPMQQLKRVQPTVAEAWRNFFTATFVQTNQPKSLPQIAQQMERYLPIQHEARQDFPIRRFEFENLLNLTEQSGTLGMAITGGQDPEAFYILGMIGFFLIALACFNYINIAIASATRRLKEIGIRKVVGGSRKQLIVQFLMENFIICFFALLLGMALAEFLLNPGFNYAVVDEGEYLPIAYTEGFALWIYLGILLLLTALTAGAYPAFYVSSFQPVNIFRKTLSLGGKRLFTRFLLTIQFILAFFLMTAGIAFTQNVKFQAEKDWGYNQEGVLAIRVESPRQYLAMRDALSQQASVMALAGSKGHIGNMRYIDGITNKGTDYRVSRFEIGANYMDLMGIRIKDGRSFDEQRKAESTESILVNETLVRTCGWENPLDEKITIDSVVFNVIGVTEDFHYANFFDPIEPSIIVFQPDERDYAYLLARIEAGKNKQTYDFAEEFWTNSVAQTPFDAEFQDSIFDGFFRVSRGIGQIFTAVALMAILLACMGLFGLVSLNVASRTKEFSIRKVLGASLGSLGGLLNREFMWLIAISLVVGIALSYFGIQLLLDMVFKFHIGIQPTPLIMASMILILTLFGTISSHMFKLMRVNPADALRDE